MNKAVNTAEIKGVDSVIHILNTLPNNMWRSERVTDCLNKLSHLTNDMDLADYSVTAPYFSHLLDKYNLSVARNKGASLLNLANEQAGIRQNSVRPENFSQIDPYVCEAIATLSECDPNAFVEEVGSESSNHRPKFVYARPSTVIKLAKDLIQYGKDFK